MIHELNFDSRQAYLGDNSILTLELTSEANEDISTQLSKSDTIRLTFDNLTNDKDVVICDFPYTIVKLPSKTPTLKFGEANILLEADLFRKINYSKNDIPLKTKQKTSLSWTIEGWDAPGTYTVSASRGSMTDGEYREISDLDSTKFKVIEEGDTTPVKVSLQEAKREETSDQPLWTLIRNRTINFNNYRAFIDQVMCSQVEDATGARDYAGKRHLPFNRVASYSLLKYATEFYLMEEIGLVPDPETGPLNRATGASQANRASTRLLTTQEHRLEWRRGGRTIANTIADLKDDYLEQLENEEGKALPYFKIIRQKLSEVPLKSIGEIPGSEDACYGILKSKLTNPPLIELIWSYWMEEAGLVQTMNAISLRFQNVRRSGLGRDPLANLNLDPLRPLNNLVWGYIEDERNRLTINRRNLEYQYEYGISLIGKAVQNIPVAENRTYFLRGLHSLLRATVEFYQQANFTTVIPDGFPILNHLREVHLMLAEGAHNQYGDLPWAARSEMLVQQWLLARPEVREFLGGRIMVPYTEPWMDRVDNMKQLQGWNPTNVTHFRDLAVFGEQLLLSIRYGSWNDPNIGAQNAANWARYWREEIQRYIHAYKAATGVDLASDIMDARLAVPANEDRYLQPAELIQRQVALQQTGQAPRQQLPPDQLLNRALPNGQSLPPRGQVIRKETFNG